MPADLTVKKQNYVTRLSATVNQNTDQVNELVALFGECMASGFVPGLGVADPEAAITDADLNAPRPNGAPGPFPHLTAADLAAVAGSLAAVKGFLDSGGHTAVFLKMRP